MSYTDSCRGDSGANHWVDCSPECSSMQHVVNKNDQKEKYTEDDIIKLMETRWYSEIINGVYDDKGERNIERLRHNIKADLKSLK